MSVNEMSTPYPHPTILTYIFSHTIINLKANQYHAFTRHAKTRQTEKEERLAIQGTRDWPGMREQRHLKAISHP